MAAGKMQRLLAELRDANAFLRQRAAQQLGEQVGLDDPTRAEISDALAKTLVDSNRYVRVAAAAALVRLEMDIEAGLAALSALLQESHRDIRIAAATAAGELGPRAEPVGDLVADLVLHDPISTVRTAARQALAQIRPGP
jgi:hypothetical protein